MKKLLGKIKESFKSEGIFKTSWALVWFVPAMIALFAFGAICAIINLDISCIGRAFDENM